MLGSKIFLFGLTGLLLRGQIGGGTKEAVVSDLRAGKYTEARDLLSQALKNSPNDASLWTLSGFTLAKLGHAREALSSYNRAIEIAPDYLPALEGAAELEYAASDQRAVPLLEKIVRINPQDQTSHAMLGWLAYKRGDCSTATGEFATSQAVASTQVNALEAYGACLVKLRRSADAIPIFQRLCDLQPKSEKARYNLAVVLSLAGRYQDVIATLTSSQANNPQDSDVSDLLAEAYEATSDTPHAVASLRQAILSNPDNPKYYVDFANLCLIHQSFKPGIDMLNAGLNRMPGAAPLYLARGILYIQLGQYDQSEQDFTSAEKLNPNLQFGSSVEGLAELQRNDLAKAEATVRDRLSKHPRDAFLNYLLAEILIRRGATAGTAQFNEALQSAEQAVRLQPSLALARDVLSRLYLQAGKTQEAIAQSRAAYEEDPTDQTALYHLILALRKADKTDEVPPLLKKLTELREKARVKEIAEHKYALVEAGPATAGSPR